MGAAMDVLLSARRIGADEALPLRLVDRVSAPAVLLDDTRTYARELCDWSSPRSMAVIKRQVGRATAKPR